MFFLQCLLSKQQWYMQYTSFHLKCKYIHIHYTLYIALTVFPPPTQVCAGVQTGRGWTLLPPAVRQLWGTKMPTAGCPLQWHPVWWDAAWIQQQNPASQLGTDIPNDLPVTSMHIYMYSNAKTEMMSIKKIQFIFS